MDSNAIDLKHRGRKRNMTKIKNTMGKISEFESFSKCENIKTNS